MIDERQMSLFEEGGMTAPEVEVDAESGNEVPPGSLPEEVRDDVDAKLSGGEYVVPADVLRYYGMKFFEDLRKQAKDELSEMDQEGRIGGEPMEDSEGASEGLTEQEMELLRQVMSEGGEQEFNQGGMVLRNPEFYDNQPQYAEGGMQPVQQFSPDSWRDVGSSYFDRQGSSQGIDVGSYYKTYVGPNGETRLILFINGEPSTPIPEGFKEQTSAANEVQEETAKEEAVRDNSESEQRAREETPANTESWAERNYEALSSDPVAFGLSSLESGFGDRLAANAGRIGMALAGPVGALAGTAIGGGQLINNIASAKASLEIAKAQGQDTSTLEQRISEYESAMPTRVRQAMELLDAGTGANYLADYNKVKERLGIPATQTEAVFSSSRSPDQAESRAREIASQYGGGGDSNSEVRTEKAKTTEGTVSTIGGTGEGNAGVSVRSGSAALTESSRPQGRPQGRPGMAKGGLVKRRQKKTKK
jgi:hypothetical protein